VRAVILDGVAPPDLVLGQNVARDAQHALDLIWERCAQDTACHAAFPEIREEWVALLAALDEAPVEVNVAHPVTGEKLSFPFTREALATTVRLHTYTPETVALLPLLIHTAQSTGNLEPLAAHALLLTEDLSNSISNAMNISVLCAEDVPFFVPEEIKTANEGSYLGDLQTRQLLSTCALWPRGEIPPTFKEPVSSEVPTLLLSGEADPVTPPEYGEHAAQTLPNSLHLIAPGQGHNVIYRGCIPRLAEEFIVAGTVEGLKSDCVAQIAPMPFFVTFTGPPP
ncbi:MAG: alpha/beta hydrolase, partial [Ardenticatenales bacterium]|nr:alpha/beta hydrolase [Ardenticatenales bacterium]